MIYENGNYISQNDLKMVYHIRTNFLEYHRVTTGVKTYLNKQNNASTEHKKPTMPNQIKIICKSNKGSKDFMLYCSIRTLKMIPLIIHSGKKPKVLP